MAFLRETPRSLRLYFLLVGGLSVLGGIGGLQSDEPFVMILSYAALALGVAYLGIGATLTSLLRKSPNIILGVIGVSILRELTIIGVVLSLGAATGGFLAGRAISLAIAAYLIAQVLRLSRELGGR